ncbi:MAG: histidine--tRNA ligase [Anaerofustis stercorihominis]|nr:histidine--tRNA ligase [Anaerofustis stercorihominis]
MSNKIFAPKGTNDILPEKIALWEKIESQAKNIAARYGFKQIRTPEFESTNLFERGVGDTTDIVQKEMYTFTHKGKESLTLKPEGTAPVVRSFIENGMASAAQPVKLFYLTNCFRCENPQKGRYRQFHQFGIEVFGAEDASSDAEVISLAYEFLRELGIKDVIAKVNSVGCPTCRKAYYEKLKAFIAPKLDKLCDDCKNRFDKNPMRLIDCKVETCKEHIEGAPLMLDELCTDCKDHFEKVKTYLDCMGVEYEVDPKIVRGLDYYTNTAFEFIPKDSTKSQAAIAAGGRYNGLVETLGGPKTAGIGLAMGIERILIQLEEQGIEIDTEEYTDLYIAPLGEGAKEIALKYSTLLRREGITVLTDVMNRSLKAQMKYADKINAKFVAMVGEDEADKGVFLVRDMNTKEQTEVPFDKLAEFIK